MRHHPAWRGHPAHGLLVQGRGRCTPVHVSVCLSSIYGKNARWKSARSASRRLPDSIRRCDKEKVRAVSRIRELCTANMQRTSPNPSCSLSNFIVYRDWQQRYTYIERYALLNACYCPLLARPPFSTRTRNSFLHSALQFTVVAAMFNCFRVGCNNAATKSP